MEKEYIKKALITPAAMEIPQPEYFESEELNLIEDSLQRVQEHQTIKVDLPIIKMLAPSEDKNYTDSLTSLGGAWLTKKHVENINNGLKYSKIKRECFDLLKNKGVAAANQYLSNNLKK